jgi:hypothetical protein
MLQGRDVVLVATKNLSNLALSFNNIFQIMCCTKKSEQWGARIAGFSTIDNLLNHVGGSCRCAG